MTDASTAIAAASETLATLTADLGEGANVPTARLIALWPGRPQRHQTTTIRQIAEWIAQDAGLSPLGGEAVDSIIEGSW